MTTYSALQTLRYNATREKYTQLETMEEDFRKSRKSFNIALVDFLQTEFSANVQLKDGLDSGCFDILVINNYWSGYRQQKLDDLYETLKDLCKTIEIVSEPVDGFLLARDQDIKDIKVIFKVTANHRY